MDVIYESLAEPQEHDVKVLVFLSVVVPALSKLTEKSTEIIFLEDSMKLPTNRRLLM